MRPAAVALALLLLAPVALPAAEAATTMFLTVTHTWSGPNGGADHRQFTVPASTGVVCYVRWAALAPASAVTTYSATLLDGDAFPVVVDSWSRVVASGTGVHTANTFPVRLSGGAFTPGVFTFDAVAGGLSGDVRIQIYGASSPSECGTLPPP